MGVPAITIFHNVPPPVVFVCVELGELIVDFLMVLRVLRVRDSRGRRGRRGEEGKRGKESFENYEFL